MEISINDSGLSTLCRLCLSTGVAVIDIFGFSAKMRSQLADVIMKCAPVQITKRDGMPNLICQLCYSQLENMYRFQMQIVQSEKTMRRYLEQFHTSYKQIKPEHSSGPSEDHRTNADITEFRQSFEQCDISNMPVIWKENALTNCIAENEIKKEMSFKSESDPMDDNSLILTESHTVTVDTLSQDDGNEITCEDTKIDVGHISGNFMFRSTQYGKEYFEKSEKWDNTDKQLYQCNVCNKCFSQMVSLNRHKRTHAGDKLYQCDICNKYFSRSSNLNNHKRSHTGEKPYQCDICNKRFFQLHDLNRHKRTHTGEKPFQCDICTKCFSQSDHLNSHKRTHTGEKPYLCDICNKTFSQSSNLIRHKRTHTDEKSYLCNNINTI